jgi:hypothetical protein
MARSRALPPTPGAPAGLLLVPSAAALVLSAALAQAAPDFTERPEFGAGSTIPVAWADCDLDGDLDLAVGNYLNQQNFLYRNEGDGTFAELQRFGQRSTFALVWGDYDNDGDPDMAVGNNAAGNRLIKSNGDGTFVGTTQFGFHVTVAMAWGDYDNDGDLDMAIGNGILGTPRQNYLYRNDGGDVFAEEAQFGIGQTASLAWGDHDGDGDLDMAVGNGGFGTAEQNFLYVNEGNGTFTEVPLFGTGDTSCLVWGDADNDGDLDLAVANWDGGQNYLYRNDGGGSFAEIASFGQRDPNTMAWGDFDNDGDLDLAVGNGDFSSADQNYLYINDGAGSFTESAQFGTGSTDALAWGDFDGDGDLDLAAGNEHSPTQNYLYVNNENDADYLSLALAGRFHDLGAGYSNRSGVGAFVLVYETGFAGDPAHLLGMRQIEAHGGFAAQNSIEAHFGLPGRSSADVRVVWPGSAGSNLVQDVAGVPVPGRWTLDEGGSGTSVPSISPGPFGIRWRIAPNPTRSSVRIELGGSGLGEPPLEVLDAGGRSIRSLATSASGGGLRAQWDGRTADGLAAASGVYFVRAKGRAGTPGRIVLVR